MIILWYPNEEIRFFIDFQLEFRSCWHVCNVILDRVRKYRTEFRTAEEETSLCQKPISELFNFIFKVYVIATTFRVSKATSSTISTSLTKIASIVLWN